ncbi:MAG: lysozyme [Methylococcaceae bacterium]|jgi:lysozyme
MISNNLINKLMLWEGVKNSPYRDSGRLLTLGVGHLLTKSELSSGKIYIGGVWVRYAKGITDEQIKQLLKQDLAVRDAALTKLVKVPLTQNQFDTLLSFVFNVGVDAFRHSDLLELLNKGYYNAVPYQLTRWNKSGGKKDKGLVNRRSYEIELWNSPVLV